MPRIESLFRRCGLVLVLLVASASSFAQAEPTNGRIISILEPVEPLDWSWEDGATLGIWEPSIRFRINDQNDADISALETIIDRATTEGWNLTIRFNALAGQFEERGPYFLYPLCSVSLNGERAGSDAACLIDSSVSPQTNAEALISLGIALSLSDELEEARELLDRGLAEPTLQQDVRFLAHRTRAQSLTGLAMRLPVANPESDRLLAEAVRDHRETFDMNRDRTVLSLAYALQSLGGYEEALQIFTALPDSTPHAILHRSTARAYAMRALGQLDEALTELRLIGQLGEVAQSMRYNVHLGTTLIAMERYTEAVSALNIGILNQPDFANAYFSRACALASLGRIEEALADQRRGHHFFLSYPEVVSVRADENLGYSEERLALLERLANNAPGQPAPEICDIRAEEFRDRSPFLEELSLDLDELLRPDT